MRIKYCLTSKNNPLYQGEFVSNERYKTYGQHSFIIDFISSARRNNCTLDLLIEGKESFPLHEYIQEHCNVVEFASGIDGLNDANLVILDKLSDEAIEMINTDTLTFCIVHNAGEKLYRKLPDICHRFICMTETAVRFQSAYIRKEKLLLYHQGVDMERFSVRKRRSSGNVGQDTIRVLLFTRLIQQKRATIIAILNELLKQSGKYNITVLGDGDLFWEISNKYGTTLTVINHIPCHSIQTFLPGFDIVISSARGVMEACASGVPALCAGLGYAGIVCEENIPQLLIRNLTGYEEEACIPDIHHDISRALSVDEGYWRMLSQKYFDMDNFVKRMIREAASHFPHAPAVANSFS